MKQGCTERKPLAISSERLRYKAMIGVGGIGTGTFFALKGNHTLGREESRAGHFLDRRDYCKLHIASHYIKTLLGDSFTVIPIGKVGDDEAGRKLLDEMSEAGLDLRYVSISPGNPTLFSFCFIYPDGTGGNMTTDDSACSRVTPEYVREAETELKRYGKSAIALAVPEVPIEARVELLALARKYGCFTAASFTTQELSDSERAKSVSLAADLIALNLDEAAAICGFDESRESPEAEKIARSCASRLNEHHPGIMVSITAGSIGSWSFQNQQCTYMPACNVEPVSTAGAGDAHLSGVIAGLAAGLSLPHAQELGTLVAGLSVASPHTINKEIDATSLREFAPKAGIPLSPEVMALLEEKNCRISGSTPLSNIQCG